MLFDPHALHFQHMPASLRAAGQQRRRWSAGARDVRRRHPGAGRTALEKGFWRDGVHRLVWQAPPFSLFLLLSGLLTVVGAGTLLMGSRGIALAVNAPVLFLHALYFGLALVGEPWGRTTIQALLLIPFFALWRLGVHARALLGKREEAWVRTERDVRTSSGEPQP